MSRFPSLHAPLAIAALAFAGCPLLYTDHINRAPNKPDILKVTGGPRQMLTFTASATDPDGDVLAYSWSTWSPSAMMPCEATPMQAPPPTGQGMTFTVNVPDDKPICVFVVVTDGDGASNFQWQQAMAGNSPPHAEFDLLQPGGSFGDSFPLYTDFRLTADRSSDPDGDQLTAWKWKLILFPDASTENHFDTCGAGGEKDVIACFHADQPGQYEISLVVNDGQTDSVARLRTITVLNDTPPCLIGEGTSVPVRTADPDEAQTFSVTVKDDGDPWPPGPYTEMGFPRFTWSLNRNKEGWRTLAAYSLPELTLAAGELTIGDHVDVRVEVADRNQASLALCGSDAPTCSLTPGCDQRRSWAVEFR